MYCDKRERNTERCFSNRTWRSKREKKNRIDMLYFIEQNLKTVLRFWKLYIVSFGWHMLDIVIIICMRKSDVSEKKFKEHVAFLTYL